MDSIEQTDPRFLFSTQSNWMHTYFMYAVEMANNQRQNGPVYSLWAMRYHYIVQYQYQYLKCGVW